MRVVRSEVVTMTSERKGQIREIFRKQMHQDTWFRWLWTWVLRELAEVSSRPLPHSHPPTPKGHTPKLSQLGGKALMYRAHPTIIFIDK